MSQLYWTFLLLTSLVFLGCSSGGSGVKNTAISPVLEPADSPTEENAPAKISPQAEKVLGLLTTLEYQGVGLEHEDERTLEFVYTIFSSPKTHGRKIQFVYTGLELSYDKEQFSLTLGEDQNVLKTIKFIEKNVPLR